MEEQINTNSTNPNSNANNNEQEIVTPEIMKKIICDLLNDPNKLKTGFTLFSNLECCRGFYTSLLYITLNNQSSKNEIKLASSVLLNFLRRNWSDDNFISIEEKMELFAALTSNIHHSDYYLNNFIAKLLGLISAKEWPNSYEVLIKKIVRGLIENKDPIVLETYLRIMNNILNECDDRIAQMTSELLPVVIDVFKSSDKSQKNREKCLKIISLLLNKLSFADGTDPDLVTKSLDSNKCIEQCLSLFISIIISSPKNLFDIKKYAIKTLDILVRDMPIYSSSFFSEMIEPAWRVLVLEMTLYTEKVVFNKELEFSETELLKIKEEGYDYTRGYESEDEEEVYGVEGFVTELIDFAVDLLKRNGMMEALQDHMLTLFLCLKGYCLMPHQTMLLWKNDPNMFITEEYDDENINSIRNKAINLMREVAKEIDDGIVLKFVSIIMSEFTSGLNPENYLEVIKLDDYNYLFPYFEKMNTDHSYIQRRHEANLLILGSLSDDLVIMRDKNKITNDEINALIEFLFKVVSGEEGKNNFLIGRALWCISRLFSLYKDNLDAMTMIFNGIAKSLLTNVKDLTISLIATQCITQIGEKLPKDGSFKTDLLEGILLKLIELLDYCNEDTLAIPIDCIISISKLNKEAAVIVPQKASKILINIYSENYNHPVLGVKLLQLIRLWCEDSRCSKMMVHLFIPFSIYVFDDFFKSLKNPSNKGFEDIKKTVITEHAGGDMDFKTNLEMLPNLIDIITILMKYCVSIKDTENLNWISLIVNVICEILNKSNDVQIIQKGTSFLRFYVPLCKETIELKNQQQIIGDTIIKVLNNTELLESSLLFTGNLIAQYFLHLQKKLELNILETIVKRIYRFKMPSIVQSMVLVYSRLLILYPSDIFKFLTTFTVENRIGLKVLIDKWLLHQPLFRGKYFKNLSIKALTILYSSKDPIIESLMVINYDPSHSNASVEVNAPFKILSVLIRCLHNEILQEKMKSQKTNLDELNYEDEIVQDDYNNEPVEEDKFKVNLDEFTNMKDDETTREINSKLSFINVGKGGGLGNLEAGSEIYLSEMLVFDYNEVEGEEEDNVEEDLEYLNDLDFDFHLKDYLLEFFNKFYSSNTEYLIECLKMLPKKDQELFKAFDIKK